MIAGLDSAYPPPDAIIAAEYKLGRRLWAGYFAGPGILNGWAKSDFDRIKAGGMSTLAYCSGWSSPAAMRAQSDAWQVPIAVDVEHGIRDDGPWVPAWVAAAGAGLYGNGSVHYDSHGIIPAATHIFSGYYGYDPKATWPNWDVRPNSPCGWQWAGSHGEYSFGVDSNWFDNAFLQTFGAGGGSLGDDMSADAERKIAELHALFITEGKDDPNDPLRGQGTYLLDGGKALADILAAIKGIQVPAGGGLTPIQAQALIDVHDILTRVFK